MFLKEGSVIRNYKIIKELKQGGQGLVFVVEELKAQKKYVLKSIFVEEAKKSEFEKMISKWKILSESKVKDYIVRYIEHFFEGKNAVMIMEYCDEGDLENMMSKKILANEKFTESEVTEVLIDIMNILEFMHSLGLIHRDVKSSNILIGADGKFKLSDFNTAKVLDGKCGTSTMAGTMEYTPPEVMNGEKYTFSADVYSLGVTAYQMMVGKTPYATEHGVATMDLLLGKYTPIGTVAAGLVYSPGLIDLVHACLARDPASRPTPAQVLVSPLVMRGLHQHTQAEMHSLREEGRRAEERAEQMQQELGEMRHALGEVRRELMDGQKREDAVKKELKEVQEREEAMRTLLLQLRMEFDALQRKVTSSSSSFSSSSPTSSFTSLPSAAETSPAPSTPAPSTSTQIPTAFALFTSVPVVAAPIPISAANGQNIELSVVSTFFDSPKTFTLLYKAVNDGFSGEAFHSRCDKKGATVTIITSSEGWVFGGYAAVPWNGLYVEDNSKQSFLFTLRNPRKTPPEKFKLSKRYAIGGGSALGPCFGNFLYDITCCSNSNNSNNSCTSLGNSYSNTTGLNGRTVFTGEYNFKAKDIEVYQVL